MKQGIYWLSSYPKSGNTWTRSFIFALTHGRTETELDINELVTGAIASSRQWLELGLGTTLDYMLDHEIERLRPEAYRFLHAKLTVPGYHKVHDAYVSTRDGEKLFAPDSCSGALYIVRNPLDVAISLANHNSVTLDKSIELMANSQYQMVASVNKVHSQVRQRMLSWSEHVTSWLDSDLPVKLVRYEDMQRQPLLTFKSIATFLGLPAEDQAIQQALDLCRFDKLKSKETEQGFNERPPGVQSFFRKGIVGDWQQTLSDEQVSTIVKQHAAVMRRLGYLDEQGNITATCYPDTPATSAVY